MTQNPKYSNVIVFGATGAIGGLVALEAQKRGAKVWLAMRDTSKALPQISSDVEATGNFARVQGDLTDPASVTKAVVESGAKAAFIYLVFGTSDHGRGALKALREAGVENIVFLSSFGVKAEGAALRALSSETDWVPFLHAQVEIGIEDLDFPYFTALRAASFSSNFFRNYLDRSSKPPKAQIVFADTYSDNIAPEDIAVVGGTVLVEPPAEGKTTLYLCGSEPRTAKENWELVKRITGRDDIDTTPTPPEVFVQSFIDKGMPEVVPKSLLRTLEEARAGYAGPEYEAGVTNLRKYLGGREPMSFVEYLEAHKAEWQNL
uniref:NAD(P)-binding domain-containing protein n=1 Tax=Mycena chlorophos TaxID=658473 RepID=A0ABQ0M834_MYCCL|nr:predicted protein [Mycena chlorophos]